MTPDQAILTLTAMQCDNPAKSWPTSYVYPQEVRDAAAVLEATIKRQQDEIERLKGGL